MKAKLNQLYSNAKSVQVWGGEDNRNTSIW